MKLRNKAEKYKTGNEGSVENRREFGRAKAIAK